MRLTFVRGLLLCCALLSVQVAVVGQEAKPQTKTPQPPEVPFYFLVGGEEADLKFDAKVRQALSRKLAFDYLELPLKGVVQDLAKQLEIPIVFNTNDLDEVGVTDDTLITFNSGKVTARTAIRRMLDNHGLCVMTRDRQLVVTNPDVASRPENLIRRLYPIADLVPMKRNAWGESGRDLDSLIDLISSVVAPSAWEDVGGPGPIGRVGDAAILIGQTAEVHTQIENLLVGLRKAHREFKANPKEVTSPVIDVGHREPIRQALETIDSYRFDGSLRELAELMTATIGYPIIINQKDLDEVGVTTDTPVKGSYNNVPIRLGLRSILKTVGLTYYVTDDAVVITNPDAASKPENLELFFFPVWDLPNHEEIVEAIHKCSAASGFAEYGGPGQAMIYNEPPLLVVSHATEVVEKIPALLASLRKLEAWRKQLPGEVDRAEYVQRTFELETIRVLRSPPPADKEKQNYINIRNEVPLTAAETQALIAFIKRNIAVDSWKGAEVKLDAWENQLLIRHKPAIVAETEELLRRLRVLSPLSSGKG